MNKKIKLSLLTLILSGMSFCSSSLLAKDIPIVDSLSLSVSTDKAVIEFPFKITAISPDEFIATDGKSSVAPEIKKGENVLEVSSPVSGHMKSIVWGYDHPIFLEFDFEKSGEKYYKFTAPLGDDKDISNIEGNPHEDVISDLVVAAYNEKVPKGYTSKSKSIEGKSAGIAWNIQLEYDGNNYAVQSWKVKNLDEKKEIHLYEEMFASEKNKIYGVSIESPDLKPGETTRVFIVKKAGE